jgi:GNAT superfamily N-acetyltransferase
MGSVAPTLSEEGIETFRGVASMESFTARMQEDVDILVYEFNDNIVGVIELKAGAHISMLFVSPDSQKKGIGRSLISAIIPYTKSEVITVSASLPSVKAYLNFGFKLAGEPSETNGLKYQPMELEGSLSSAHSK